MNESPSFHAGRRLLRLGGDVKSRTGTKRERCSWTVQTLPGRSEPPFRFLRGAKWASPSTRAKMDFAPYTTRRVEEGRKVFLKLENAFRLAT